MTRYAHLEGFDRLTGLLATTSRATASAIRHASAALLSADREAGEAAIAEQALIGGLNREIADFVPVLLARRQPVASDLRLVVSAVRMNADMERMAALAAHIADIALARYPALAVPAEARATMAALADAAAAMADKASMVLATRDPIDAGQAGLDDDVPDALQIELFAMLTDDWPHGVQTAIDLAMLGRFYERFADHAVSVARQVLYRVTGDPALG